MKRKVIFWGCGNIAETIYHKYKDEISLLYGISNNPTENIFEAEKGRKFQIRRPERKAQSLDAVIVICSVEYEGIAEQLILLGYSPFSDFIDYEMAEIFWSGKDVVLLYGSCHFRGIRDCLRSSDSFLKKYIPIYYSNYLFHNFYQQERFRRLINYCKVFIYGIDVSPENYRKNTAVISGLKPEVKRLRLHTVYFGGYFPQMKREYNDMNKFAVKCEGFDYTPFSYGDSWLNKCIANGRSLEDVFDDIESKEIYGKDFILRYLENEWLRLKYQEKESDFKIVNYIEKNYRKVRLFRNETHMENCILRLFAIQLMEWLGCSGDIQMENIPLLNCSQHFIYPCVSRTLGLEWDVWSERLDLYTYAGWEKVTMREYIERYYETCSEIYRLKKMYLLP